MILQAGSQEISQTIVLEHIQGTCVLMGEKHRLVPPDPRQSFCKLNSLSRDGTHGKDRVFNDYSSVSRAAGRQKFHFIDLDALSCVLTE